MTPIFGHEASLSTHIGQARVPGLRLDPVDASLGVQELHVGLFVVPDQGHLEGVEQVRLLVVVPHIVPGDYKHRLGREISRIIEAITDQLGAKTSGELFNGMSLNDQGIVSPLVQILCVLGLKVGDGSLLEVRRPRRVDVRVEGRYGRVLDGKGEVDKVRVLAAEC